MKYLYFPGCSLRSTNRSYEESLLSLFNFLSLPLEEIDDWNCCGATAYMAVDEFKAFALAARNLALAERQVGELSQNLIEVVVPCSGCYLILYKTNHYLNKQAALKHKILTALQTIGLDFKGNVSIRHPLDIFVNDVGLDTLSTHVRQPLKGLKVACYYGCQIVRPFESFDTARNPSTLERIVTALGAEPIDWPLKTHCCGGTLMGTIHDVGLRLNYVLLKEVKKRGADLMITTCPLCQINLECYQNHMARVYSDKLNIPVLFFTQLMGLAFGISGKELGIQRLFISPSKLMKKKAGEAYVQA
ncbi:CoB--CoM heterodisulfide reductase iron-sulfur subunit B family protein [candidate division CSSED10-310 bacterium]|uniref:CoB--CoM heterodisulfide reductase iron-sulfur subunit B family protein n=1 Tax=candidate division CSSED10-310 bacterium TaxID=2855610 RepID=A0ABV6Z167_UNCC1